MRGRRWREPCQSYCQVSPGIQGTASRARREISAGNRTIQGGQLRKGRGRRPVLHRAGAKGGGGGAAPGLAAAATRRLRIELLRRRRDALCRRP